MTSVEFVGTAIGYVIVVLLWGLPALAVVVYLRNVFVGIPTIEDKLDKVIELLEKQEQPNE